jgi:hypothetical protein
LERKRSSAAMKHKRRVKQTGTMLARLVPKSAFRYVEGERREAKGAPMSLMKCQLCGYGMLVWFGLGWFELTCAVGELDGLSPEGGRRTSRTRRWLPPPCCLRGPVYNRLQSPDDALVLCYSGGVCVVAEAVH